MVLTGPAVDSRHCPTVTVELSFVLLPAQPKQWLFAEPRGDTPCREV